MGRSNHTCLFVKYLPVAIKMVRDREFGDLRMIEAVNTKHDDDTPA
jgi:hypothetical protein